MNDVCFFAFCEDYFFYGGELALTERIIVFSLQIRAMAYLPHKGANVLSRLSFLGKTELFLS